jgi:hypothetical protein
MNASNPLQPLPVVLHAAETRKVRPIRNGFPVNAVRLDGTVVARYRSRAEAARAAGVNESVLQRAAENGWRAGGTWWRYADMPDNCQPLRTPRRRRKPRRGKSTRAKPVEYCGAVYPSIHAAARAMGLKPNTLWKRITRRPTPAPVRMWELNVNCPTTG